MIIPEIRERLWENSVVFDNASYDGAIVGVTTDGAAVYDYDLMIKEFMTENECTYEEAADWIDYNTIRVIPYTASEGIPPVVMYTIER